MNLSGKTAIITGAAGVLGQETARQFARQGASLVLVDRDHERLVQVAGAFLPSQVLTMTEDVTSADGMERVAQAALTRFGAIDIFFANAGVEGIAAPDLQDYPDAVFDEVIAVNLRGVYVGVRVLLKHMRPGGAILITSSIAGLIGMPMNVAYTASKHGVVGIRRACAALAGPMGIRVNSIHPGFVDSEMVNRLVARHPDPDASRRGMATRALLGRLVRPDEVGKAAVFLCSDDASAITNHGLVVDCGVVP